MACGAGSACAQCPARTPRPPDVVDRRLPPSDGIARLIVQLDVPPEPAKIPGTLHRYRKRCDNANGQVTETGRNDDRHWSASTGGADEHPYTPSIVLLCTLPASAWPAAKRVSVCPKMAGFSSLVELHAQQGDRSIALLMNRSSAERQRSELEAEGWLVEVREPGRSRRSRDRAA